MNIKDFYPAATQAAQTVNTVMVSELNLQPPAEWYLDATGPHVWLIAAFNPVSLAGKIVPYTHHTTLHQVSTALGGKPVILSNHSGLRYGILLSERPTLPFPVSYPEDEIAEPGVMLLGRTLTGKLHLHAADLVNVALGGEQKSGKSQFLHLVAYNAWLNGWPLYLADPQSVTFDKSWSTVSPLPVATNPGELLAILDKLYAEMDKRGELFGATKMASGLPVTKLEDYNDVAEEKLPRIFLLVDEGNTFLDDPEVLKRMTDLSRQVRKYGIHLVVAAHNWREIRKLSANFHTRISLRVADDTSAAVLLDSKHWGKGLMKVKFPGRGVLKIDGRFQRVQFYKLADELVVEMLTAGNGERKLTDRERGLAIRARDEADGKVTLEVLQGFGLGWQEAGRLLARWKSMGWAAKDPARKNATYMTLDLVSLL